MATSTIVKNFRDGKLVLSDRKSPTPTTLEITLEEGNFQMSVGGYEIVDVYDRGEFATPRKGKAQKCTWQITAHATEFSSSSDITIFDLCTEGGKAWGGSGFQSSYGANAEVKALDVTFTMEGTAHGDAADHSIKLEHSTFKMSFTEGQTNSFSIQAESRKPFPTVV